MKERKGKNETGKQADLTCLPYSFKIWSDQNPLVASDESERESEDSIAHICKTDWTKLLVESLLRLKCCYDYLFIYFFFSKEVFMTFIQHLRIFFFFFEFKLVFLNFEKRWKKKKISTIFIHICSISSIYEKYEMEFWYFNHYNFLLVCVCLCVQVLRSCWKLFWLFDFFFLTSFFFFSIFCFWRENKRKMIEFHVHHYLSLKYFLVNIFSCMKFE